MPLWMHKGANGVQVILKIRRYFNLKGIQEECTIHIVLHGANSRWRSFGQSEFLKLMMKMMIGHRKIEDPEKLQKYFL